MSVYNGVPRSADEQASPEDVELAQALETYLAALEDGRPPDAEQLVAEHPAVADRLRACLAGLRLVEGGAASLSGPAPTAADGDAPPQCLGDFRIVREVGRGGMGVVYEAEQVSLRRRVALKVLPLAATLGGTQLQRFHNEARAAAGLHHTNIVPVYAVGCERGVHFYAMQFIDGQSLAAVLARLRPADPAATPQAAADAPTTAHIELPAGEKVNGAASTQPAALLSTAGGARGRDYFRAVAELGVQAAEALDYGHRVGVVHRDIKPGNLLLDGSGRLWVTDFGLAQVQGAESLTATGELVGTLRYMSPEQALAKRVPIDHRTDVYSLGATLYELLTLRPVFDGRDRQELLRQIAFEEPRPLRKVSRAVPAELEVIVLKALEKAPQERYGTAQELADDLRRWLDDRPIQARRPSAVQRLRKWARRYRAAVNAAAACLLLVLAVVAGSAGWVARGREARRQDAVRRAGEALRRAEDCIPPENWPEGLREIEQAEGFLFGFEEASLRLQARHLCRDMQMAQRLQEAPLQAAAVKDAGYFNDNAIDSAYAAAFREYGLDVDTLAPPVAAEQFRASPIRRQLVAALDDWSRVRRVLKREGWRQRLSVARAADPDEWRNRLRDALEGGNPKALEEAAATEKVQDWPLATLNLLGNLADRTTASERVAALLGRAQLRHPDDFCVNETLGTLLFHSRPPRREEAIRFLSAAVALRPRSPGAHLYLGLVLQKLGRLDEAEAEDREAIRLQENFPMAHCNLGWALAAKGHLDGAVAEYREAIRLKQDFPLAHCNLGAALREKGRPDEAVAECQEALRLQLDYPVAHYNLGAALHDKGRLDEAIAECQEAVRLQKDDAMAHLNLGSALGDNGRLDEAITEFREAIRLKKDYVEAHSNLGIVLRQKGRLDEAIAECREVIRLKRDFSDAHTNLGAALADKGKLDEAMTEFREAIRLKEDSPEAHTNLGLALMEKDQMGAAIAEFRKVLQIKKDYPDAHRNLQTAERLAALEPRLPNLLDGKEQPADLAECLALAQLCQLYKHLYAAAARWYGVAFALQPVLADDLSTGNRYNAACAAALAGCGQGGGAGKLADKERAGLRKQARDWLRADLEAWRRLLEQGPAQNRPAIAQQLAHWLEDTDLAGVRGEPALAKLPEAERGDWRKLWADVADTLARAQGKPMPATKPDPNPPPDKAAAAGHAGA